MHPGNYWNSSTLIIIFSYAGGVPQILPKGNETLVFFRLLIFWAPRDCQNYLLPRPQVPHNVGMNVSFVGDHCLMLPSNIIKHTDLILRWHFGPSVAVVVSTSKRLTTQYYSQNVGIVRIVLGTMQIKRASWKMCARRIYLAPQRSPADVFFSFPSVK